MKRYRKPLAAVAILAALAGGLTACSSDADIASENISKDADNFKILRRVVFYNGVTGAYILVIEGYCSLGNDDPQYKLTVTCKTAVKGQDGAKDDEYKKHFLGLSDNVTYFAEQITAVNVSTKHYKVIFKPESVIPDPEVR